MTFRKMRILFIGTVDFSYSALSVLLENNFEVVGLVTKKTSKINADYADLLPLAKEKNIPYIFREKDNEEKVISFVREMNPDIIYCFGWSHLLSSELLSIPRYGVVGFHPAELPNNRGRHPIIWALFLGLSQTASTFFIMDEGADTGDIISQEIVPIDSSDTAESLYKKVENKALKQIVDFTEYLEENQGNIKRIKQDPSEGNSWRKRGRVDGKIDFRMTSEAILNLIKALTHPYVGAHIEYNNEDVKVWEAQSFSCEKENYEPGKVIDIIGDDIIVKTYDAAIRITKHEFTELPKKNSYL